jgi:hypothetical protein
MSSVTLAPAAVIRPAVNPWCVATAVVVPTFMEIVDTTIATASLRYIAGGLSATMGTEDTHCIVRPLRRLDGQVIAMVILVDDSQSGLDEFSEKPRSSRSWPGSSSG